MIIKKYRTKPLDLIQHERLLKRLPKNHPQYNEVDKQIRILASGYYGEKTLDYHISHISHDNLFVFQDLRLPHSDDTFFQMDFLLFTPQSFVILDSKYLKGKVRLSEYQMVQELDGSTKSYKNPVDQVHNQLYKFKNLLRTYSYPISATYPFVVFSNSNSILEISSNQSYFKKYILRPDQIRRNIIDYYDTCATNYYSIEEMKKLSKLLLRLHTPKKINILEEYKISNKEIIKGVFCPSCGQGVDKKRVWKCKLCGKVNQNIYLETLLDYYYLFGEKISTKACMDFLDITSRHVAYRIMSTDNCLDVINRKTSEYRINLKKLKREIKWRLNLEE